MKSGEPLLARKQRGGSRPIAVGHTPDMDDAFMFYAIASGAVRTEGLRIEHVIEDIQSLNRRALKGEPLTVTGKVRAITDGRFKVTGPMATGTIIDMGRTVVLDTGTVQIVVSERRSEPFDLGTFTHCGIDPRQKRYVLIKSRQHFRAGFEPIAKHIVLVDGPGATTADFSRFKFKNIRRPLYPIDWNEPQ